MHDFIFDPATHSAGVAARFGQNLMKKHAPAGADFDQLSASVRAWLEESELTLDLDGMRAALAALSLALTRKDAYFTDSEYHRNLFAIVVSEVAATLVHIFEHQGDADALADIES